MRRGDRGEVVMEFIAVAIALLVPIAYAVVGAMTVQAARVASAHAVREAGRAFVLATSEEEGRRGAQVAARLSMEDQGFPLSPGALMVTCERCLEPGDRAVITLDWTVPLPLMPPMAARLGIPVHARHVVMTDEHR